MRNLELKLDNKTSETVISAVRERIDHINRRHPLFFTHTSDTNAIKNKIKTHKWETSYCDIYRDGPLNFNKAYYIKNFTKSTIISVLARELEIASDNKIKHLYDIGCGFGGFGEMWQRFHPGSHISYLDKQHEIIFSLPDTPARPDIISNFLGIDAESYFCKKPNHGGSLASYFFCEQYENLDNMSIEKMIGSFSIVIDYPNILDYILGRVNFHRNIRICATLKIPEWLQSFAMDEEIKVHAAIISRESEFVGKVFPGMDYTQYRGNSRNIYPGL
ncbi:hypothetical protein [Niveispirillum lacus]|uniref:hypothetical protein n=1 Tax=Niveispirillum lacus TaxID=1981099 RepID=UPI0010542496|nr:hypothetical protein [Niveispirillum lacus]